MVMKRDEFFCCRFLFPFLALTAHKTQYVVYSVLRNVLIT